MKDPAPMTDKQYIAAVHELPCVICDAFGEVQLSPTEFHHVFHGRFSQHKTPDNMGIPLCNGHHTGSRDNSKLAIHPAKQQWAEKYGFDYDYSEVTRDKINALF